jgi:hypothetical protein
MSILIVKGSVLQHHFKPPEEDDLPGIEGVHIYSFHIKGYSYRRKSMDQEAYLRDNTTAIKIISFLEKWSWDGI